MNLAELDPKAAAPSSAPVRRPSALAKMAARCSGTVVSVLLHAGLILMAFLSIASPRSGRGGGVVGGPEAGSGPPATGAIVRRESTVDGERSPDARLFPQAEPEPPEAVPPPLEDFILAPPETGIPVEKTPPVEDPSRVRPRRTYEKLPPSGGSEAADGPPKEGAAQKGNSAVNGIGGDTGGAGDGTVEALYMPAPEYPASARRRGIEGVVIVVVTVLTDGRCADPKLVESSGNDALDEAALTAIQKWRYEPHAADEPVTRRVRFVFKLRS